MKKVYNYDPQTFEFIGDSIAQLDPLESEKKGKEIYLLPANATFTKAPSVKENEVAVFNPNTNRWSKKSDYRGTEYWDKKGNRYVINEIGKTVPKTALLKDPNSVDNEKNIFNMKRREAYGSIGEQLDMLYWDMRNGTNKWQQHITRVKKRFKKGK